jgi:hypothetical protein
VTLIAVNILHDNYKEKEVERRQEKRERHTSTQEAAMLSKSGNVFGD